MDFRIRNCRFAFKCQQKWEELDETSNDSIRFCNECQKEVHLSIDDDTLVENIRLNRCVAIDDGHGYRLLGEMVIEK